MTIDWMIHHHEQVGSTNDLAKVQARAGAAEGLVLVTEEQLAGRGRQGRGWTAPPGSSLLMSVLLRPTWLAPSDVFLLTMLAGVALCEAVETLAPIRAALKWPNDLLLAAPAVASNAPTLRKAAGILSETEVVQGRLAWVVIGLGVNVNWTPTGIMDGRDLAESATSVSDAAKQPIERRALRDALLAQLDQRYRALRRGQREALVTAWRTRLATLGQRVSVRLPQGALYGTAEDVAPSGALRLRDDHGVLHEITAGEVS